jgi:hypothetical protein
MTMDADWPTVLVMALLFLSWYLVAEGKVPWKAKDHERP